MTYRPAVKQDLLQIQSLLEANLLPSRDIVPLLDHFIVAVRGRKVIGVVGREPYGRECLLRSLAVDPRFRERGIGKELLHLALASSRSGGASRVYILTTTIEMLCRKWGFKKIARARAPKAIQKSGEFMSLCPKTAVLMCRDLRRDAHCYPLAALPFRSDVTRVRM